MDNKHTRFKCPQVLKVSVHPDPVSDQLVGDGLTGRDHQACAGSSVQGLDSLNKRHKVVKVGV